ncbi:MAG: class II fumarate hydratase, partial [Acetobacteraceae bacterium]|nr:class II fumarate hydratase [Acetobacteraceae bacterium]
MKPNDMAEFRREKDALGEVSIPAGRYWGAQTERARHLFQIGDQRLDFRVIRAMGTQKWVAAAANQRLGLLPEGLSAPIQQAAAEIELGLHDAEFPLPIWQTGSGTQTNMNANEVIANRANEFLGHALGAR